MSKITIPGNVHDSVSFFEAYAVLNSKFKDKILDAAYTTPPICREIILNNQALLVSYKKPMTGK